MKYTNMLAILKESGFIDNSINEKSEIEMSKISFRGRLRASRQTRVRRDALSEECQSYELNYPLQAKSVGGFLK